jgi:phytoene synthase
LNDFERDTYDSISEGVSLNPILNSFQKTVNDYQIPHELIDAFLKSMRMDLHKSDYTHEEVGEYIYGSAEVVGLMCLRVFCDGNDEQYKTLSPYAKSLGAAFQKINFLRDLKDDYQVLGRSYFADINFEKFDKDAKRAVEADMKKDFDDALIGIKQLPSTSRFGVYIAYIYYYALFRKIEHMHFDTVTEKRIRISNFEKYMLLIKSWILYQFKLV